MQFDIIECVKQHLLNKHGIVYTGKMELEKEDSSYTLRIGLNRDVRPIIIGGEFPDDESFTRFINKELDSRRMFLTEYYTIKMTDSLNRT